MTVIHPSAVVDPRAQLGEDVEIGPFCHITGAVTIGRGTRLIAAVHLQGPLEIGAGGLLYPNAALGFEAQDLKIKPGSPTLGVKVGDRAIIRENSTIHAATKDAHPTTVGDDCYLMCGAHIGHDTVVGNKVILGNNTLLAGHVTIADQVITSGHTAIHQFNRVGRLAFISGAGISSKDVPPFCIAIQRHMLGGINLVGMRRSGMPREHITLVRRAYARAFREKLTRQEMIDILTEMGATCPPVMEMAEFVRTAKRSVSTHGRGKYADDAKSAEGVEA